MKSKCAGKSARLLKSEVGRGCERFLKQLSRFQARLLNRPGAEAPSPRGLCPCHRLHRRVCDFDCGTNSASSSHCPHRERYHTCNGDQFVCLDMTARRRFRSFRRIAMLFRNPSTSLPLSEAEGRRHLLRPTETLKRKSVVGTPNSGLDGGPMVRMGLHRGRKWEPVRRAPPCV